MANTYSELLKDPRWQKKRLEIMQSDNFTCQLCYSTIKTLHVHHSKYESSLPWETSAEFLITVCEDCHNFIEKLNKNKQNSVLGHKLNLEKLGVLKFAFLVESFYTNPDWLEFCGLNFQLIKLQKSKIDAEKLEVDLI